MRIVAYVYSDPLLEVKPDPSIWGLEIDQIYEDLGQHSQLKTLIQDCQTLTTDYLLLRRLDELGNTITEVGDRLKTIEDLGVEVITIEQDYHTDQGNQKTFSETKQNLFQLLQTIQKNQRRRKLQQGHARNRIQALPPPGKAPYGYRRGKDRYLLDRSTAPIVKDFFDQFLLFGSLRGAVRYLEKRYGKKIAVSTGQRWLNNPIYRGDLAYNDQTIISDTHLPIISREEAAQVERLLRRNRQLPSRTASAPRSLAGLVVCQRCQSPQTITQVSQRDKPNHYLYLRPTQCSLKPKCPAIRYEEILTAAIQKICEDLPPTVAQLNLPNLAVIQTQLKQQIQQKERILAKLSELQKEEILDKETTHLRAYKIKAEIAELRSQLDQLPPGDLKIITQAVSLPQFWLDLSETERRFYFREFIRKIEIIRSDKTQWDLQVIFIF
ncbi:MAG: recombinase family protein [Snowella sp.]|nr:recombinase family protein [Snowella sp.]